MSKPIAGRNEVLLIPGFLGDDAFFEPLLQALRERGLKPRVWNGVRENPHGMLLEWARALPDCPVMVGYSLGGRVLLHRLLDDSVPSLDLAVVISAHPGLPEDATQERSAREASDEEWAVRLEADGFEGGQFLEDWNSQAVFQSGQVFAPSDEQIRSVQDYRKDWAWALRNGSLAQQADLRDDLKRHVYTRDLLWFCGEADRKFSQIYTELEASRIPGQWWRVSNAGHRVPLEQPAVLAEKIHQRLSTRF